MAEFDDDTREQIEELIDQAHREYDEAAERFRGDPDGYARWLFQSRLGRLTEMVAEIDERQAELAIVPMGVVLLWEAACSVYGSEIGLALQKRARERSGIPLA